ncbi:hypothetical protein [Mangrovimonas sp. ST2L15]|uniref:hypothetical protein n=1 Tax=Mangrovimonas sp. ST2L15 TaxID=1645916 RepID=UPI0006B64D93|nr:hypothetical protein [Mangrovimonas sp. ST2L15]
MTITINDETLAGKLLNKIKIEVQSETITLKDLIAARVQAEVEAYNQKSKDYFNGLVIPVQAEKTLNGYKLKDGNSKIDIEQQTFIAWDAFQKNGYFVLIDDEQAEDLEQELLVNENTSISFVKLTPLVGG